MRFRLLLAEAASSARASLSTTFAATVTVLIGMFLLGFSIALGTWMLSWSDKVKRELVVKVFFCTENTCPGGAVSERQINRVRLSLESNPLVKEVKFVSKDDALAKMKKQSPDLVKGLSYNPLPDAEEVIPKRAEYVQRIAENLRNPRPPGVEKIDYGQRTASRILRVGKIISSIFIAIVVLLLGASTLLIANTIRLSIYARRREIEVMKLVGASNWFVRGPFMLEGLFCGLAGSALAVVLLLLGKELVLPAVLPRIDAGSDVQALAFFWTTLILIGVGLLLGAAGSGLTLRRFLRV
jgi:cell division transport system permease protein